MTRKIFVFLAIIITTFFASISSTLLVFAEEGASSPSSTTTSSIVSSSFHGECRSLLGLVSWDCNVDITNEETLKSGVWTIAANVLKDGTVIAAYLILGYVIYGGYQYIFSGGEPNKTASGKKTLTNGFIGLAIVLTANIIISAIRVALSADFSKDCISSSCADPTSMVSSAIQWVIAVCGIIAAVFIVYGGILYITSSGEPNKTQQAKQTIIYALIGLAIVALAEIITAFVSNIINNSTAKANYIHPINQQTTKEISYHDKKN